MTKRSHTDTAPRSVDCVILAAGIGSRMRSKQPKSMLALAGKQLLTHILDSVRDIMPAQTIVIENPQKKLSPYFQERNENVRFVSQPHPMGTADAVGRALPFVQSDTVLLLLGDVPLIQANTLQALLDVAHTHAIALITHRPDNPAGYGRIVRNTKGAIVSIVEEKDASAAQKAIREVNTGLMAVRTETLRAIVPQIDNHNAQQEYYLTDMIAIAAEKDISIGHIEAPHWWEVAGVNTRKQLAKLERAYQRFLAERLLADGVYVTDPDRFDMRGTLSAGHDVVIDINVLMEGAVTLGNNVHIGAGCVIKNSVIGDDCVIAPYSVLEGAEIGRSSVIGPFARIRPGTVTENNIRIGNFVEVKNTHLAEGSKAGHLAYLGDAYIGARTNIGAGTITCNYDGEKKHNTTIGADSFIGSNTQLIAPITVGSDVLVAAGSTVTQDVPDGRLAVARAKQRNIRRVPKKEQAR